MSASYIPRTWRERLGTNLNKFLKSSETAASVILENAPDAITQAGTPFTAAAMQNIENGIENNYWFEETALGQSARSWTGMAAAPNGDIYATAYGGDIYKQSGGTGNFIALGQTSRAWYGMTAAPNGDVYACVTGGDIYKQTGGAGNFVALGQTVASWFGMTAAPNGDVYACVYGGGIYKQTGGAGNFVALSQASRNWRHMAAAPNGDVYACVNGGDIYKQTGGVGGFVALGQTVASWFGMTAAPDGELYAGVYNGDIYTFNYSHITPASIFPVTVTSADVTVTENRFQTIRFSGALTGNRVVTMPADVRQYKLICDCTGSYYIHVKTASGTGVYLAPGDVAEVYCDGTDVVTIKQLKLAKDIVLSAPSAVSVSTAAWTTFPADAFSEANDVLSEFNPTTNVFTAKNPCLVRLSGQLAFAGASISGIVGLRATVGNPTGLTLSDTIYYASAAAASTVYVNPSGSIRLASGQTLTLQYYIGAGTSVTLTQYSALVISKQ